MRNDEINIGYIGLCASDKVCTPAILTILAYVPQIKSDVHKPTDVK